MATLGFHDVRAAVHGRLALEGLSVAFEEGKVHAILGERRSGKSAIPLVLAGAARLLSGSVSLGGKPLRRLDAAASAREGIGLLFQEPSLIPSLDARENVLAGRRALGIRARADLAEAELWIQAVASRWGLRPDPSVPVRRLSHLEASVVEFARASAYGPRVLVLDEPAGRFTADELFPLYDAVNEVRKAGVAVVYIATTVDEVFRVADYLSVMRHGRIAETHDIRALDRSNLVDWAYSFTESREELFSKNIELLKYQRYSSEIVSHLPVGSAILDEDGRVYLVNGAALRALGLAALVSGPSVIRDDDEHSKAAQLAERRRGSRNGPLGGRTGLPEPQTTPEDAAALLSRLEEDSAAAIEQAIRDAGRLERMRAPAQDGRMLDISVFPFYDEQGARLGAILTVEDVTDSLRTQEYLVRAERASSIAQLAAGVAHEVNNPLAIISNYVELLIMRGRDDYARDRLGLVRDEIKRIQGIVTSLLSFSAIGDSCLVDAELSAVVTEAILLLSHEAERRGIRLGSELPSAPTMVRADPSRVKQVLINLVINAMEALAGGGTVTVRITDGPGRHAISLEVEDDGPGIPEAVLARLFEPFVRGDKPQPHAGLGLSVCKHIAAAHGGSIACESRPGRTRFTVGLPRSGPPPQHA